MLIDQTGRWRWYFNRHGAAPLTWCVAPDDGAWEIAVKSVVCHAPTGTGYDRIPSSDKNGRPTAYACCHGRLTVSEAGIARIE